MSPPVTVCIAMLPPYNITPLLYLSLPSPDCTRIAQSNQCLAGMSPNLSSFVVSFATLQ